jgi:hypothetical protein
MIISTGEPHDKPTSFPNNKSNEVNMVTAKAKALGLDTLAQSVSIGYVIVFLIVLTLVLVLNKTTKARLIGGLVTVGAFALLPYWLFVHKSPAQLKAIDEQADFMTRYEPAKALFEKLCKEQAGEKIYRTVDNVEGILLLRVRPEPSSNYRSDQMWAGAALINEPYGDYYIKNFLLHEYPSEALVGSETKMILTKRGVFDWKRKNVKNLPVGWPKLGYRYVEYVNSDLSNRVRYTIQDQPAMTSNDREVETLKIEKIKSSATKYAVTFDDDVNPEYRKYWIAGTTLKVVDTISGELLATSTFFRFDGGLGNTNQRSPWGLANVCGKFIGGPNSQTRLFVDQVLKPIQSPVKEGK